MLGFGVIVPVRLGRVACNNGSAYCCTFFGVGVGKLIRDFMAPKFLNHSHETFQHNVQKLQGQ